MLEFIASLLQAGILQPEQAERLSAIESRRAFSVHAEIRAMWYAGALMIVVGVGATVAKYVDLGPAAVLSGLAIGIAASFGYCVSRLPPYSAERVESPTVAFDYALYVGCALIGVACGYLESHFHLLKELWDYYLLASGALFIALAYRFDNKLVLATGLANVAGWVGLRLGPLASNGELLRVKALAFGLASVTAGLELERRRVKAHFVDVYLNLGVHLALGALVTGVWTDGFFSIYGLGLSLAVAAVGFMGMRRRAFQYLLYALLYGYFGVTEAILKFMRGWEVWYFLISGGLMLASLYYTRQRFAEDA
jgi:hypothetical protein